jgi:hypothetical protein
MLFDRIKLKIELSMAHKLEETCWIPDTSTWDSKNEIILILRGVTQLVRF